MRVFVSGTDTDVGKTVVCSFLCLHTGYSYFKPIQSGTSVGRDSELVSKLSGAKIYPESFSYRAPLSPHLASRLEGEEIDIKKIKVPDDDNLVVEGAGGLLVPINKDFLMIDLIKYLKMPVVVVSRSRLGTINHTLLSLEVLRSRRIEILGVIISGDINSENSDAIKLYGETEILAELPIINPLTRSELEKVPLTKRLKKLL